ncbi:MAG: RNA-binding transcriptional accessory protein [Gemmatimonadetes bacterium]|nr:RNA-binding transcriptional accessory protein [Gemmatimonadota bacterium]
MPSQKIVQQIASELSLSTAQVQGTLALFEEGNTLPFIARYRKEATGGLDEVQLRDVRDRGAYLDELEDRRAAILASIEELGKLTDGLRGRIRGAETKQELEDLYLPYKPKRRTRAIIAREKGLEPLADGIWSGEMDDAGAAAAARSYVDAEKGVESADDALQGARDILAERVADDADLRGWVRDRTRADGLVSSRVLKGKQEDPAAARFRDYFEFSQKAAEIPSHRMLAIRRGETEDVLTWAVEGPSEEIAAGVVRRVVADRPAREQLTRVAADAYRRLLSPSIQTELRLELKERADAEAIEIFGRNLEQLLLSAPAGERTVIGLDPGFRTGVKAAVVSKTGAVLDTDTLYLHQEDRFAAQLRGLVDRHRPDLIAIGNGTASRETEQAARNVVTSLPGAGPRLVVVNEAGASVYSASDTARDELPGLDVSLRGAVSIARRLQDPLAELVKIDPKSIGVGQYQHDVDQPRLKGRLDETVTFCVNRVGVELNTASPSLLAYVAGLGPALAKNIVELRDAAGGLRSRKQLLEVPRLGPRAFEQAAGFLRLRAAEHPLDRTGVHPERYALVERMARDLGMPLRELVENEEAVARIDVDRYLSDDVGRPTLSDILDELRRPGRDPRDTFEAPAFREDVTGMKDLKEGMRLEGVVTNVVAFGAFVDVGVHQDGLVHISQLADRYVKDPGDVVSVGQKVQVTVIGVDLERNRIGLSMKSRTTDQQNSRTTEKRNSVTADKQSNRTAGKKPEPGTVAPNGMRFG